MCHAAAAAFPAVIKTDRVSLKLKIPAAIRISPKRIITIFVREIPAMVPPVPSDAVLIAADAAAATGASGVPWITSDRLGNDGKLVMG